MHEHRYEKYGDHGPEDYGDELAEWCPGCGRARKDIEAEKAWHEAWLTGKDIELQNAYTRIGELESQSLNFLDRDIIRLALRGDTDMRRYAPEVKYVCRKLNISEPPWFDDEVVRARFVKPKPEPEK